MMLWHGLGMAVVPRPLRGGLACWNHLALLQLIPTVSRLGVRLNTVFFTSSGCITSDPAVTFGWR